jgi:hypothetical protein
VAVLMFSRAAHADVDWLSPLGLELGVTPCKPMQRQKRQTWDLWVRSTSEVTGGPAFFPEKPVLDGLPDLRGLAIVCDAPPGRVTAVWLNVPRHYLRAAVDAFTYRHATVKVDLADPAQGAGQWRDETDFVDIRYDERQPGSFSISYMTQAFHDEWENRLRRFPRAQPWYLPPN